MSATSPLVSVFMTARNAEPYLALAVRSILSQSLPDFEFLIIDDASEDATWERLNSLRDERLKLSRNETAQGQSANYNRLLAQCRGKYLAKMDADDISLPDRFRIQVDYLEKHPAIWACSGVFKILVGEDLYEAGRLFEPEELRAAFLFQNCLGHPFMMFRGETWRRHAIRYDEKTRYAQDYELWLRLLADYPEAAFANVRETVGLYRHHAKSVSVRHLDEQRRGVTRAQMRLFKKLGFSPLDPEIRCHYPLFHNLPLRDEDELAAVLAWTQKLKRANAEKRLFDPALFERSLQTALLALIGASEAHLKYFAALRARGHPPDQPGTK